MKKTINLSLSEVTTPFPSFVPRFEVWVEPNVQKIRAKELEELGKKK